MYSRYGSFIIKSEKEQVYIAYHLGFYVDLQFESQMFINSLPFAARKTGRNCQ